jgi:hypothetical protein
MHSIQATYLSKVIHVAQWISKFQVPAETMQSSGLAGGGQKGSLVQRPDCVTALQVGRDSVQRIGLIVLRSDVVQVQVSFEMGSDRGLDRCDEFDASVAPNLEFI